MISRLEIAGKRYPRMSVEWIIIMYLNLQDLTMSKWSNTKSESEL